MTAVRVAALAGLAFTASSVDAGQAQPRREPATYTAEQADAGFAAYAQHCASCHGENLDDGPFAPPLRGTAFREAWLPRSVEALFTLTSTTMPQDRPGVLDDETVTELVALMLQENGVEASGTALPADPDLLAGLAPGWSSAGGGLSPGAALPPWPAPYNPLDGMQPVTDEALHDPPAGDWLLWRRTYSAYGYSPLDQIDRENVTDLRVAWSWSLPRGPNESTPIVRDGVLFVHGYGDRVQALDAAGGDFLWEYQRRMPGGVAPSLKRGMSIYGDRLFVPTSDAHIVALDAKTGDVVWDRQVGDLEAGLRMTGGTLVARGKVMVGTTGRHDGGNYVVALDIETGEEAWRFGTIPGPDEPGGHTWNGLTHVARNGASVWIPGSYDPVNNLALFGTGNTYDTAPLRDAVGPPGTNNDGLYLDATLALNADTGELAWHFQHQANGQWDLDWAFERQIAELPVDGEPTSVVVTVGKQAIFDFVEAATGRYVSSLDLGLQTGITAIDPVTGRKTQDPRLIPGDGETKRLCPHVGGGRSWAPTAYDPRTHIAYVPIIEACMDLVPVGAGERGSLTTGVRWTVRPRPESDGQYGRLEAVNLATGETAWIARQRAPQTTGALATGGGLVFAGSLDRRISAYDAATGDRLWATRLSEVPNAPPITYAVDGRQYVAVIVGSGGYLTRAYSVLAPEIRNPPDPGAALWVFAQPERGAGGAVAP
ncbi:MAG: PQQ-binding-like beta-propeller repeat protein [Acidobacteria bacterium]|nr:PQQ-binding-like beta-propeller repeat protein [Acidobacteriota bacterium]